jgi:hypothetical protein
MLLIKKNQSLKRDKVKNLWILALKNKPGLILKN